MLITMTCTCGADLQLDLPDASDNLLLLWAQRFADAHAQHGFMAPLVTEERRSTKTVKMPLKDGDN